MKTNVETQTLTHPIVVVEYASMLYDAVVRLRQDVLRSPLGMTFTRNDLARDKDGIMFAMLDSQDQSKVLACLQLFDEKNLEETTRLKLRQMAVDPEQQGQGLGQRIVWFAENWALQNKYTCIALNARVKAQPFYQKLGYTIISDEFIEIGIPHVVMEKELLQKS